MKRAVGTSLILALAAATASAQTEIARWDRNLGKPAPELMAAGWVGQPVTLRAVRGNTVILLFWNPDLYSFSTDFLQTVEADYVRYAGQRNLTFVSVCSSMTASLKQVERYVDQYRLRPFPTMLDAGGATTKAYEVPKGYGTWLVILDGEGKFLYNASKGWYWSGGPDTGKYIHHTQTEASLKKWPGLLGKDVVVPSEARDAAHLYDLQQFLLVEPELRKLEHKKNTEAAREFAALLRTRITETRQKRLSEIETLAQSSPVQAYREAVAFVAAFPAAPEKAAVNELGKGLLKTDAVKKELQAEDAYRRILMPELAKTPKGSAEFEQRVAPLLQGYLKLYSSTEYAQAVVEGVESYKMSAARSR